MVDSIFFRKVLNRLEKYLIRKSDYRLLGETYDLILLVPSDNYAANTSYSVILSSRIFDPQSQKDIIKDIFVFLNDNLLIGEYNRISRINIVNSGDSLVKNINFAFKFRNMFFEIVDFPIGGVKIDNAILVKSLILDRLVINNAVSIRLVNGTSINVGIIRIEEDYSVICYTAEGLREFRKPPEQRNWDDNDLTIVPFDQIDQIF